MDEEIKKKAAKEWCAEHSNKLCKEDCEGCWQLNGVFGCEQHNMELAYMEGARRMLEDIGKGFASATDGYRHPTLVFHCPKCGKPYKCYAFAWLDDFGAKLIRDAADNNERMAIYYGNENPLKDGCNCEEGGEE